MNYFFAVAFLPAAFFFAGAFALAFTPALFAGAAFFAPELSSPTTVATGAPFLLRSASTISRCAILRTNRNARPIGAGRIRFMRGPSFATACFTYKLSRSTSRPFSVLRKFALSIADCNSLPTVAATRFFVKANVFRASSTRRPLIRFSTSRAFCGETRMYRASARNSIVPSPRPLCLRRRWRRRRYGSRSAGYARRFSCNLGRRFHRVPLELPGKAEFTQLMPHHVLGHIYRNEFPSVMHGNRMSHHLRNNRRAPRPRPQHFLLVARIHGSHLRRQVRIHERSFFC